MGIILLLATAAIILGGGGGGSSPTPTPTVPKPTPTPGKPTMTGPFELSVTPPGVEPAGVGIVLGKNLREVYDWGVHMAKQLGYDDASNLAVVLSEIASRISPDMPVVGIKVADLGDDEWSDIINKAKTMTVAQGREAIEKGLASRGL